MRPGRCGSAIAPRISLLSDLAVDVVLGSCSWLLVGDQVEDVLPARLVRHGTHHDFDGASELRYRFIELDVPGIGKLPAHHDGFLHETPSVWVRCSNPV